MSAYFHTAYVAKCYVNEVDSGPVRALLRRSGGAHSSSLCIAELSTTLLRHERDGALPREAAVQLRSDFLADVAAGIFVMLPMSDRFIERAAARVAALPASTHLRAGDALHLCAATEAGFTEVWTNDRHMLAAAGAFGLRGRSV